MDRKITLYFKQFFKYFKLITNDIVTALEFKVLSDESIKLSTISDNSLNPRLDYFNNSKF